MNVLYIGDIMGEPGIEAVKRRLPGVIKDHKVDFVIAQAENVTEGKGMKVVDFKKLQSLGVDAFTGGNWTLNRKELIPYLDNPSAPLTRPANYPAGTPGKGYKIVPTDAGPVLIVSLLGQIVGKDSKVATDNPLKVVDDVLKNTKHVKYIARIVNFHGDFSSEKRVIGYYLDGRVSAVIGDHWHVPTADAMILPKGTAHISDVGMCGSLHSSLGIKLDIVIKRWHSGILSRNVIEADGPLQFNAVLIDIDIKTGLANSIEQIQRLS